MRPKEHGMATRQDFLNRFESTSDALAFETQILSSARRFLSPSAIEVLDHKTEASAPEYWDFLLSQLDG
jgi:hypothetical protein